MSVGRIRALVRNEMRQLFRDPKTSRIIFVSPIIQLLMLDVPGSLAWGY